MKFDAVLSNPPYSVTWSADKKLLDDPRFKRFKKLAPKAKGDYAFILHDLFNLSENGTAAIILPHGILFRGAAEGTIREELIKGNFIDGVIGLPSNLFDITSIPILILVLKKHKTDHNIFFIDASKEFEKGQNQNILREQEIDKIVKIYRERKDVDKYAHLATPDEIRDNDYNLNIPRYVDTFEPEPPVDVHKLVEDFTKTTQEINQTTNEIISMMDDLEGTTLESQKELNIVREMLRNGQTTESTF
ncbi:MAG: N-6 DNA methylase [Lentilactobacillus hilgardii]|nr:N-6 DNA methylase [Lentilactobacillus hilgardii]MBZ2200540.1 hypothetical protein [Lentilactobacillus hilgardii]MBZ2204584.1 hypothetical protein [Lentilactobacillus hilgardii]